MRHTNLVGVPDANVLVPVVLCDLLLTASVDRELFRLVVSDRILDEVERNLIEKFQHLDPAALTRRVEQTRRATGSADVTGWEQLEPTMPVNAKDRHVFAVAVRHEADLVVTSDRRFATEIAASGHSIIAVTPDELATMLLSADLDAFHGVIDAMAAKRRQPPATSATIIGQLAAYCPNTVAALQHEPRG